MVFSSIQGYVDPPNWHHQQPNHQQANGSDNTQLLPPLPPQVGGSTTGGGTMGSIRPGSMADRARLAKLPPPEPALKCPRCDSTNTKFCYFNICTNLPPGFRFHPTDAELILHYLRKKIASIPLPVSIIAEVDIYKLDPWDLPAKASFGEKEWYFFSPRDRKYPNGARPNRAAASGYWKATGTDKTIVASLPCGGGRSQENIIGVKKALVFYKGKPPKGIKTNWIMHEYRLVDNNKPIKLKDSSMRLDDWVLCRIYKKSKCALTSTESSETMVGEVEHAEETQFQETLFPITKNTTSPLQNTLMSQKSVSFSNLLDAMDYSMLSSFLSENSNNPSGIGTSSGFNTENFNQQQSSHINTCNNYMSQKNPQSNTLKHQLSNVDEDMLYPSKKYLSSSCNFPNINSQYENYLMKQSLMNQQLLLGPHHQYQG